MTAIARTSDPGSSWLRAARLSAVLAAAAALLGGTAATAAGPMPTACHTNPREVDTLDIAVEAGAAVRGRELTVEIVVTRRGTAGTPVAAIGGADLSVRLRVAGTAPVFAGGRTDPAGHATVVVPARRDLPTGAATLVAEAWAQRTPGHWCVPSVEEHGYVETPTTVTSRG